MVGRNEGRTEEGAKQNFEGRGKKRNRYSSIPPSSSTIFGVLALLLSLRDAEGWLGLNQVRLLRVDLLSAIFFCEEARLIACLL